MPIVPPAAQKEVRTQNTAAGKTHKPHMPSNQIQEVWQIMMLVGRKPGGIPE